METRKQYSFLKFREKWLIRLVNFTKPWYARFFKKGKAAWQQSLATLKRFPPKTLGHTLGNFLETEGFELMPKLEDHDVLHVLLNYKTSIEGEVQMQFFLLGNGKKSLYALFTAILGPLVVPEAWSSFLREFKKGRKCMKIINWDFEHLLCEPIELLQQQIFKENIKHPQFLI